MSSLCILDINPLSDGRFAVFSLVPYTTFPVHWWFSFLCSFWVFVVPFVNFCFCCLCFWSYNSLLKITLMHLNSWGSAFCFRIGLNLNPNSAIHHYLNLKKNHFTFSVSFSVICNKESIKITLLDSFGGGILNELNQLSSVTQSSPTLCNPIDYSTLGFLVYHQLTELA